MLSVALTGNIASGKSSVSKLLSAWGAVVIDADRIVHELQRPGTDIFRAIVDRFGLGVLASDGTLDRRVLRERVFGYPDELEALNAIVHPAVAAERDRQAKAAHAQGASIVVNDIPLLFETTGPARFDAVILVDAPGAVRLERLMAMRGLTREVAEAMIAAQAPAGPKRARSTFVIENDADFDVLERRTREVWAALQDLERGRPSQ
jgi:dephospho-CoA kinase